MKKLLVIILAVMVAFVGATGCASLGNLFNKEEPTIDSPQTNGDKTNKEDNVGEEKNENKGPGVVGSITNGGSFDGGNYN